MARWISNGNVVDFGYDVWSNTHSTRPESAGNTMVGWLLSQPFAPPEPKPIPQPTGGGDRNAIPIYKFPNAKVTHHFISQMPLRVSALRSLGAYMNIFAIESFMDEMAVAANADPIEFRLKHLEDTRAKDVIETVADRFNWKNWRKAGPHHGRGFAFAKYKNLAAYVAVALDMEVDRETGRIRLGRAVAADDSGQAVNPDGIKNQVEGAIVQAASWTLQERVAFDRTRITSRDWATYPNPAFRGRFPQRRGVRHRQAKSALSRHRRGGARSDCGGNCQCSGRCHWSALPRVTLYPRARENGIASK